MRGFFSPRNELVEHFLHVLDRLRERRQEPRPVLEVFEILAMHKAQKEFRREAPEQGNDLGLLDDRMEQFARQAAFQTFVIAAEQRFETMGTQPQVAVRQRLVDHRRRDGLPFAAEPHERDRLERPVVRFTETHH
jgi:hypothetical protein